MSASSTRTIITTTNNKVVSKVVACPMPQLMYSHSFRHGLCLFSCSLLSEKGEITGRVRHSFGVFAGAFDGMSNAKYLSRLASSFFRERERDLIFLLLLLLLLMLLLLVAFANQPASQPASQPTDQKEERG